mmetsp:Transcript_11860/g.9551  ORF Transcript_11860/g.9551 Transcript_11860/m.9551 type:complete len:88 (-) Transcript_11860:30-293(-)
MTLLVLAPASLATGTAWQHGLSLLEEVKCVGELIQDGQLGADRHGLHCQHVQAVSKAVAVEDVANAPADEDLAPGATDHRCSELPAR